MVSKRKEVVKDYFNKPCKYKLERNMTMLRRNSGRERITLSKKTGQISNERIKHMIKLNLQNEETQEIIKERRRNLIKERYNATIVRNPVIMLMNDGLVKKN